MLRAIAAGGAALAILALAACGHRAAAAPVAPATASGSASEQGATLSAYVMDATPTTPTPSPASGGQHPAAQQPQTVCSQGQDAYKVLIFLVSADTGKSVQQIVAGLQGGQSLASVAGSHAGQVKQQAAGLVQGWLQFAEANGKLTADQAEYYLAGAVVVIGALMDANVSACIPTMS